MKRAFVAVGRAFVLLTAIATTALVGCDQAVDGHYGVTGTATFGGKPMESGRISFQPTTDVGASSAAAQITNGKFSIPAAQGLFPGEYSVVFSVEEKTGEKVLVHSDDGDDYEIETTESHVPLDWGERSTQKITIEAGKNVFHFDVPRSDEPVAPPEATGMPGGGA